MPTDRERLTNEMKAAVLMRRIMGDISIAQIRHIYRLFGCDYDDKTKGTVCGRSCAEWYTIIKRHFQELDVIEELNAAIIFHYYFVKTDLNEDEEWKMMMLAYFSPQTILKIRRYTQVPQMAEQDESEYKENDEESWTPFEKIDVS